MNTAAGALSMLGFAITVVAGLKSVEPLLSQRIPSIKELPLSAVVLWLVVAVPSLLQIPFPGIYDALHRDRHEVIDHHQWWRVATSVVVQDGGVTGTVFNLIILAIAAYAAVKLWGGAIAVGLFTVAGIGLNVMAVAFDATDGGGNSGATLPLLASLPVFGILALKGAQRRAAAIGALVVAVCGIAMVAMNDGHGISILLGLIVSAVVGLAAPSRVRESQAKINRTYAA